MAVRPASLFPITTRTPQHRPSAEARQLPYPTVGNGRELARHWQNIRPPNARRVQLKVTRPRCRTIIAFHLPMTGPTRANVPLSIEIFQPGCRSNVQFYSSDAVSTSPFAAPCPLHRRGIPSAPLGGGPAPPSGGGSICLTVLGRPSVPPPGGGHVFTRPVSAPCVHSRGRPRPGTVNIGGPFCHAMYQFPLASPLRSMHASMFTAFAEAS